MIYLDNAATSFPKPERVYRAMDKCMREYGANPGRASHRLALEASRAVYKTRMRLCSLFNIDNPMEIVFTSNATEALNLGIKGLLKDGDHVVTSSMEHNSVARPLTALEMKGISTTFVQCDSKGMLHPEEFKKAIKKNTALIIVTHASNVTGTLMPINDIGILGQEMGIPFMVDAAQTSGVYDIDVQRMHIDMLAFPGHKGLLGPQGTGGLFISKGLNITPMKEGGTGSSSESLTQPVILPDRYESGTPNTAGIVGLGEGIEFILDKGITYIREHEEGLTDMLLEGLKGIEGVEIYGPRDAKLQAGVVSINVLNGDAGEISYILDRSYDIATRSGLHCSPLAHKTIGTLERGALRLSIGPFNDREDIETVIKAIHEISLELR